MMWRLKDVPAFSSAPTKVEAQCFNAIRRALMRSNGFLRITIDPSSHLDLLIDEDSWVCVDASNNDFPMVAWLDFESESRDALHAPVQCRKNYYHFAAGKVAAIALKTAIEYINEHYSPAPVCDLNQSPRKNKVWKTSTQAELSCV